MYSQNKHPQHLIANDKQPRDSVHTREAQSTMYIQALIKDLGLHCCILWSPRIKPSNEYLQWGWRVCARVRVPAVYYTASHHFTLWAVRSATHLLSGYLHLSHWNHKYNNFPNVGSLFCQPLQTAAASLHFLYVWISERQLICLFHNTGKPCPSQAEGESSILGSVFSTLHYQRMIWEPKQHHKNMIWKIQITLLI